MIQSELPCSAGKESTCNAGDPSSIPGSGRSPWRRDRLPSPVFLGFPGGLVDNESPCNAGDLGSITGLGRSPGEGHGNPLQYSCLENPHGQRSLVGHSPWGHNESDKTKQLSTHTVEVHGHRGMFRLIPGNLNAKFIFSLWERRSQSRVKYLNTALCYPQAQTLTPQTAKSSFFCSAFLKIRTSKEQARLLTHLCRVWLLLQA